MSIIDRINNVSNNTNLNIDSLPITCKIEITGICTLNCKFCYHNILKQKNIRQKHIEEDLFLKILNEIKTVSSIKEVGLFYMGESGLNKDLSKYYKILKENNYFTFLTTNATNIKYILKSIPYIDSLKVSWNYKNIDDFIFKTNSSEKQYINIKNNIKELYKECHKYNIELAISTILDDDKKLYTESLQELIYDEHYWIPLQTQAGFNSKGLKGVVGENETRRKTMPCWSLFNGLYFDVDGNVRICCYGNTEKQIIDNITNTSLIEILKSKKFMDIKYQHLNNIIPEECKKCLC